MDINLTQACILGFSGMSFEHAGDGRDNHW